MPTIQLPHRHFEDVKSQRNFEAIERYLEEGIVATGAGEARGSSLQAKIESLEKKVKSLETKVSAIEKPEAWKKLSTLTYKNSWVDEAATPGEYRKDASGTVYLRGTIKGGANETEAFTLPAGYRPTKTEELAVLASLRNIAEVNITTAGVTKLFNGPTSEVKTYCTLHVFFSVE